MYDKFSINFCYILHTAACCIENEMYNYVISEYLYHYPLTSGEEYIIIKQNENLYSAILCRG